jgi:hypothetical protein
MFPPGLSPVLVPRAAFPFSELFRAGASALPRRHHLSYGETVSAGICFRAVRLRRALIRFHSAKTSNRRISARGESRGLTIPGLLTFLSSCPCPAGSSLPSRRGQERTRIAHRMPVPRIIEVDVDSDSRLQVPLRACRALKCGHGVVRGEGLWAAMHAAIREVGREHVFARVPRGIGQAQSYPMTLQELVDLLCKPGFMPELADEPQFRSTLSSRLQKVRKALLLSLQARRKLEKERAEVRAQGPDRLRKALPRLFHLR